MSLAEFKEAVRELYQGEVIGEVFFDGLLKRFDSPDQRYKLATLYQLETETKARMRPIALELDLDIAELDGYRKLGHDFVESCNGMDWKGVMTYLGPLVQTYVDKFKGYVEIAPPEYKEVADSMVVHEAAILAFANLEASGDTEHSLDDVINQLKFPMKPRS